MAECYPLLPQRSAETPAALAGRRRYGLSVSGKRRRDSTQREIRAAAQRKPMVVRYGYHARSAAVDRQLALAVTL
jgi:hypothetical protein